MTFPEPTDDRTDRGEVFLAYLDFFRERAVEKVSALAPGAAERSHVPSGWSPAELLHHLAHVERRWLEWGFLGLDVGDPWGDEVDGRWQVDAGIAEIVEELREQGRHTVSIVRAHRLDEVGAPGPRWHGEGPATLERVLFHLLQEWERHLGQLDVVVELAGGPAGE